MTLITVKAVTTRAEQKEFIQLPWRLYSDTPQWVPPLLQNHKELLGFKKHPFYETNEIQTFLAYENGKVVGRVAAILNRGHIERYEEPIGFFGFFESIEERNADDRVGHR